MKTKVNVQEKLKKLFENKIFYSPDGCWYWTGTKSSRGYGACFINGDGSRKSAHRCSYEFYKGQIPKGFVVCHHCDNRICVNPDHLFTGTQKDNVRDMIKKGRQREHKPEDMYSKILSAEDVLLIVDMSNNGFGRRELGKLLGIAHQTISSIMCGHTWDSVTGFRQNRQTNDSVQTS